MSDAAGASERSGLVVTPSLVIPRAELSARATRAGGPGGQHVNTSSTRVELMWDLPRSVAVDDERRALLAAKLASRLDAAGQVRVVASASRSQRQNRDAAEERLVELVREALLVQRPRRATKPTRSARQARLDAKRRQGEKKRERRGDAW